MATIQRISSDISPTSTGRCIVVRLGDEDKLERDDGSVVFTVNRKLPPNLFEAHAKRIISDAQLMADQEKIDVVFVCFDPQLRE